MCVCGNPPQAFREKQIKAGENTCACYECGETIKKGELYTYSSGVWDCRPDSFRWCNACTILAKWAEKVAKTYDGCFCFTFGSLHEDVQNLIQKLELPRPASPHIRKLVSDE